MSAELDGWPVQPDDLTDHPTLFPHRLYLAETVCVELDRFLATGNRPMPSEVMDALDAWRLSR